MLFRKCRNIKNLKETNFKMIKMKKLTLWVLMISVGYCTNAQTQPSKVAVGVHAGTQGLGVNGLYPVSHKMAVRLSASYAPYGFSDVRSWSGTEYDLDMKSKMGNVLLQAEYRPFNQENQSAFLQKLALTAGAAYFYESKGEATATPKNNYTLGDIVIDKKDIGAINVKSTWNTVAPYAGLGIRQVKLANKLALNVDLGTHYMASPDIILTGDKLLADNDANQATLQKNMEGYRWLPVLQTGISYQF